MKAGADETKRRELIRSFLRLSLASREAAIDWKPIEQAAIEGARPNGNALDEAERYPLEFAIAVAARHDRNAGELSAPPENGWPSNHYPFVFRWRHIWCSRPPTPASQPRMSRTSWVSRYASCEPREALPHQLRLLGRRRASGQ